MEIPIRYVQRFTDRHGRKRYYFRRRGYRCALPAPGSADFHAAYAAALAHVERPEKVPRPRSVSALIASYYRSAEYVTLADSTKRTYRLVLERFRERDGEKLVEGVRPGHIKSILAKLAKTPGAARDLRKRLAQIFDHAIDREWIISNPVRATKAPKSPNKGFRPWTDDDLAMFVRAYPAGSRERLALCLLLYTDQRRSDVATMGRQHVKDGAIHLRQFKNRDRSPVDLIIDIHPELQAEIDRVPATQMSFLVNRYGRPFSHAGFTNWFSERALAAGLPKPSTPHGVRKAGARRLAENGATTHEIMSVSGHRTLKEVERYTVGAAQKRLAKQAMATIREQTLSTPTVKPPENIDKSVA